MGRIPLRTGIFTTDGVAPEHRHDAWQHQPAPSTARLFDAIPEPDFTAESEIYQLGPLRLNFGRYGAQRVIRSSRRIRADGNNDLALCLLLSGEIQVEKPAVSGGGGTIFLWDLGREWEHFTSPSELISLTIPRALAITNDLDPVELHGIAIEPRHTGLLRRHLETIRDCAPMLSEQDGPVLARTIIDLLAVSLSIAGRLHRLAHTSFDESLKSRAERVIIKGIENPELSPEMLCHELSIARATLYRLFSEAGGVQTRIRQVRLNAARIALQQPEARVIEVAERFGFGEPAYFSRVFRARFGVAPSVYRTMFRQGLGGVRN